MEIATDVFPLTAYCEHPDCIKNSYYTYRFCTVDEVECTALFFDPLIIAGRYRISDDPKIPNYTTKCDQHHYLIGKECTFLTLEPLGGLAYKGNIKPLLRKLNNIECSIKKSEIHKRSIERFLNIFGGING